MDYSKLTLAELLSQPDRTIQRNAVSILKVFQKKQGAIPGCQIKYCENVATKEGLCLEHYEMAMKLA